MQRAQKHIIVAISVVSILLLVTVVTVQFFPKIFVTVVSGVTELIIPKATYQNGQIVTLRKVVDGDTVDLQNGDTIRLLNIDTPETVKANTPVMCGGLEASNFSKSLMKPGDQIIIKTDKEKRDKYGRLLAFLFAVDVDSTDVANSYNAQLVKLGYARSLIIKPNSTYQRYFTGLEREAKQSNLGVWQCPRPFVE